MGMKIIIFAHFSKFHFFELTLKLSLSAELAGLKFFSVAGRS